MGENFKILFGKRVRVLRRQSGMSQEELGALLGYNSSGMISQIENGLKGMDREKVVKAAKVFGVPVSVMLSDEEYSDTDLQMFKDVKAVMRNPGSEKYKLVRDMLSSAAKSSDN